MRVIHGPMPGVLKFSKLGFHHWDVLKALIQKTDRISYELTPVTKGASKVKLTAPLQGGNLCVLASLCGTDFQPQFKNSVLFLEEIDESAYRLDRLMNQLVQSGVCDGILGIVLGTFTGCMDRVPEVQSANDTKKPLRPVIPEVQVPASVFTEWGKTLRVPVWQGLPIGHGDGLFSLSMGQKIRIEKNQLKIEF
jgi:muramoyltetrapeptide carboxypeptidase LdcA involved in peptidoglycan recycling